jgi:hypothetical protein
MSRNRPSWLVGLGADQADTGHYGCDPSHQLCPSFLQDPAAVPCSPAILLARPRVSVLINATRKEGGEDLKGASPFLSSPPLGAR